MPDRECPMIINDILSKFEGAMYFSLLDLTAGYWQIALAPESRKYTAFLFNGHNYEFQVLPFGLNVSVGCFIKCINSIIGPDVGDFAITYVDDILIWSKDFNSHLRHLRIIFDKLNEAGVTVNRAKSGFTRSSVKFFGHLITAEGIRINPEKVQANQDFPEPKCKKDLQAFLGLVNFYSKFTCKFSEFTQPLSQLLRKNVPWVWDKAMRVSLEKLKQRFIDTSGTQILKKLFISERTDQVSRSARGCISWTTTARSDLLCSRVGV